MTTSLQSAGRTDIGMVRQRNEDAILLRDDVGLWAVADGLGGHAAGDHASGLVVERLAQVRRDADACAFIEAIEDALAGVNLDLRREARARNADLIATTVVVLVRAAGCMLCGWVGDSRGYAFADGALVQLTRDHVYRGEDDSATPAAGSGVLTRAVGAEAAFGVDWVVADSTVDATFVLCSDGLNKEMTDAEIGAACGRQASAAAVLDELFATALGREARDNISAVVVRVRGGARASGRVDGVNRALRELGEAQRVGRIDREVQHARRRHLLGTLIAADAGGAGNGGVQRDWAEWLRGWIRRH